MASPHLNYQIVKVLKLNDKTPVIVILYDHALSNNRKPDNLEFCERELSFLLQPFVAGSIGAQQLLLRLLRLNAPRLPESYKPFRQPYERDFHLSFLMPTGPLTLADIGSLNKDKGCDVCGEKAFKNCASCGIALYCGKRMSSVFYSYYTVSSCLSLSGAGVAFTQKRMQGSRLGRVDDSKIPTSTRRNAVHGGHALCQPESIHTHRRG